jgi:hypothetical protein
MKRMLVRIIAAMLFVGTCSVYAGDVWNVALASGDTLRGYQFKTVSDSTLIVAREDTSLTVTIDSISSVIRRREGSFWTGAAVGAVAGGIAGGLIGSATYKEPKHTSGWFGVNAGGGFGKGVAAASGVFIGSLAGLAVGGLIGSSSGKVEEIILSHKSHIAKVMILRTLMKR